jgi:hypothetical protein
MARHPPVRSRRETGQGGRGSLSITRRRSRAGDHAPEDSPGWSPTSPRRSAAPRRTLRAERRCGGPARLGAGAPTRRCPVPRVNAQFLRQLLLADPVPDGREVAGAYVQHVETAVIASESGTRGRRRRLEGVLLERVLLQRDLLQRDLLQRDRRPVGRDCLEWTWDRGIYRGICGCRTAGDSHARGHCRLWFVTTCGLRLSGVFVCHAPTCGE